MNRTRVLVLMILCGLWPAAAQAQLSAWWDYIEKLSGPGPFKGPAFDLRLYCFREEPEQPKLPEPRWLCPDYETEESHVRSILTIPFGFLNSGHNPRFDDTPNDTRTIQILRLSAIVLYRIHSGVDLGGGLGIVSFSDDGFERFSRATLTPVAALTPVALLRPYTKRGRVLRIRVAPSLMTKGWSGADFGSLTRRSHGPEWLTNKVFVEVWIDGLALIYR